MTNGPYLYDDGPEPLHTGAPRRRPWFLVVMLGGTVLVAVLMAITLPLVRGSAEEQSQEVAGVFLAALVQGDEETAHGLLCEEQRRAIEQGEVAGEYLRAGSGEVVGSSADEVDGDPVQRVDVRWDDGSTSELLVVPEDGARICGITG